MVGKKHLELAQLGGGGYTNRYHTRDELHRIPEGLVREILRQLANAQGPVGAPAFIGAQVG